MNPRMAASIEVTMAVRHMRYATTNLSIAIDSNTNISQRWTEHVVATNTLKAAEREYDIQRIKDLTPHKLVIRTLSTQYANDRLSAYNIGYYMNQIKNGVNPVTEIWTLTEADRVCKEMHIALKIIRRSASVLILKQTIGFTVLITKLSKATKKQRGILRVVPIGVSELVVNLNGRCV